MTIVGSNDNLSGYIQLEENNSQQYEKWNLRKIILGCCVVIGLVAMVIIGVIVFKSSNSSKKNPDIKTTAIFAFNDVYEIIPVNGFGGLARVATFKKEIEAEFPDGVISVLPGDFYAPSALGTAPMYVDGKKTNINGKQMVDVLNSLNIDFATLGNHEFDIPKSDFLARLNESKFKYITTNVLDLDSKEMYPNTIPSTFVTKNGINFAFLGVVIDSNKGAPQYADIPDIQGSITKVQNEIRKWREEGRVWDYLIAVTHISVSNDKKLVDAVPEIDLVLGGHEHDHMHILTGTKDRPVYITKADSNVKTVFVHRISFDPSLVKVKKDGFGTAHMNPKAFKLVSELKTIDAQLTSDSQTQSTVDKWWEMAKDAFNKDGFDIDRKFADVGEAGMDITEAYMRNKVKSPIGDLISNAFFKYSQTDVKSDFALFNAGSVRIDDFVRGVLIEYDVIRILPFGGELYQVKAKGKHVKKAFNVGFSQPGRSNWMCTSSELECDVASRSCNLFNSEKKTFVPLDDETDYVFVVSSFVAKGGDNYFSPDDLTILHIIQDHNQQTALRSAFEEHHPYDGKAQLHVPASQPTSIYFDHSYPTYSQ